MAIRKAVVDVWVSAKVAVCVALRKAAVADIVAAWMALTKAVVAA